MNETTLIFLEHYGVKGQKWGVRNKKKPRPSSSDFKTTKNLRGRKVHELTNKQIKAVNERMNLEQNYSRLNQSRVDQGHDKVKKIVGMVGTASTIYAISKSPMGQAAISAGKKFIATGKILKVVH